MSSRFRDFTVVVLLALPLSDEKSAEKYGRVRQRSVLRTRERARADRTDGMSRRAHYVYANVPPPPSLASPKIRVRRLGVLVNPK